ncbi:hypothetical protein CASFOL_010730 [Castilleja foliolosa]|uniref:Uncharacterized protein n=1 Tax=Castilleja foliolosa TaxID=1961234 RepID=A0ABD3DXG6_9LAMI
MGMKYYSGALFLVVTTSIIFSIARAKAYCTSTNSSSSSGSGWSWSYSYRYSVDDGQTNNTPIPPPTSRTINVDWKAGIDYQMWAIENAPFFLNDILGYSCSGDDGQTNNTPIPPPTPTPTSRTINVDWKAGIDYQMWVFKIPEGAKYTVSIMKDSPSYFICDFNLREASKSRKVVMDYSRLYSRQRDLCQTTRTITSPPKQLQTRHETLGLSNDPLVKPGFNLAPK